MGTAALLFGVVLVASATEPPSTKDSASWTERRIDPALRDNWAFRPLQAIAVPADDDHQPANPIDRFLAVSQRKARMTPNPFVDRRSLIRRLSFTLLGLPPSVKDVAAFVADTSPDATEQLIDRLLASPHYGVRWGQHWLDIARFAESHGYEHDYDRPTAYHYRDFVVQAWNADRPFDEFVRWQIAGDRLAPKQHQAWMATGFLAAGPHSTQITKREVERQRYDELDDMVSTIGTGLLGLNIGCARCHDHPYDPILQADFYRFAANFTRTVRSEIELDFDPAGYRAAQLQFAKQHAPFNDAVTKYEATGLRTAYQRWRRSAPASVLRSTWLLPSSMTIASKGEPQWTEQPDGSWLVTGTARKDDEYWIRLRTTGRRVTAVRLEALTDPSMMHGGPGRDTEGNFALSGVKVVPLVNDDLGPPAVPIARAVSTFDQVGAGIAGVLDQRDDTAWGVDPQLGRSHAAVFHLTRPVDLRPEDALQIHLEFHSRPQASLGRLRISFSTLPSPDMEATTAPMPDRVATALQREPSAVTNEDWTTLARWFAPQDAEWQRLDGLRRDHAALAPQPQTKTVLVATEDRPAIRLHTQAAEEFLPCTEFLTRGDATRPIGIASPGVLQVLSDADDHQSLASRPFVARWLTDVEDGAGALLARVIVNRLWQHHFGTGLVATPDDFGTRGSGTSHRELLEWLAAELVRHDWQLKPIQRLIVTSAAYQRTSFPTTETMKIDPDNRLLVHWTPRRLDAEALRDAMLFSAGSLDDRMEGPSEREPQHRRRSLYTFIKRSAPDAWLAAFDRPDGCRVEGRRPLTQSPMQALALLNSEQSRAIAATLADRCRKQSDDPLRELFHTVLQRDPSVSERDVMQRLLGPNPTDEEWADLCQTMLSLDEFVFLD